MSLRSKIALVLVSVIVLFVGLDNGIQRWLGARRTGSSLEERALADMDRIERSIDAAAARLERVGRTVGVGALGALDARISDALNIDLAFLCKPDGEVVRHWTSSGPDGIPVRLREFPTQAISSNHALLEDGRGWLVTEGRLMLVASIELLDAEARETRQLILGRFVDAEAVRDLWFDADVELTVHLVEQAFEEGLDERLAEVSAYDGARVERGSEGSLHVWRVVNDVRGAPALLLEARTQRRVGAQERQAANYALLSTLGSSLAILTALLVLLRTIVIGPLGKLTQHAVEIGRTDDMAATFDSDREDEIGVLAREFDSMVGKLADSREELVRSSRLAGKADVSTEVLHNIGNVLTSVKTSWSVGLEHAMSSPIEDLEQLVAELDKNADDLAGYLSSPDRADKLARFLDAILTAMRHHQDEIAEDLRRMGVGVDRIQSLVQSQERHADAVDVLEWTSVQDEVEEALQRCGANTGPGSTAVVREYEDLPRLRIDRHRLTEALVPLFRNALQSIEENGGGTLLVRVRCVGAECFAIDVVDDGVGIASEDTFRIFNGGFTTRADSQGMGLHMAANTATEMGGQLEMSSEGPGRGATFTLRLPAREGLCAM